MARELPRLTVTLQVPPAVSSAIVMLATTVVGPVTVVLFTVTPGQPKLTAISERPLTSMDDSVIVTSPVNPVSTDAGLTLTHPGSSALISKPPEHTTVSAPVVTVTLQAASAASAAIVILAVIWVALLAVALFTVTPGQLKVTAEVAPKFVLVPVITTSTVDPFKLKAGSTLAQPGSAPQVVTLAARLTGLAVLLALSLATMSRV